MDVDMSRQKPEEYEIYRHFKGTLYQIVTMALYSETGGEMVVYRSLYEPSKVYAEPLPMFMSEVDGEEYPNEVQRYRFERLTQTDVDMLSPAAEMEHAAEERKSKEDITDRADGEYEEGLEADLAAQLGVNPLLLEFLDADTYESKLNILVGMRDKMDEGMLNAIAVSLDLEFGRESLEEKYEEVKNCLVMMEKYECNRLR